VGAPMKLVCGLGNPGREYARHRHNAGRMVVEALGHKLGASFARHKSEALAAQVGLGPVRLVLLLPETYMNLSGVPLGELARFYKLATADVLVVHDELDLPFGRLQLKDGGGTGGHNGLKSIRESWGEDAYGRLRFGIGKPQGPDARERVVGHVLGDFSKDEAAALPELLARAAEMAEAWARLGMAQAMNAFNRR